MIIIILIIDYFSSDLCGKTSNLDTSKITYSQGMTCSQGFLVQVRLDT